MEIGCPGEPYLLEPGASVKGGKPAGDPVAQRVDVPSRFRVFVYILPEPEIPADETPLQAGDVIAIEPGIYHPVTGGMRLEGNYLVTPEGAVPLTRYAFQLIACGE